MAAGDAVSVTSDAGEIETIVRIDEDLLAGVVSMVHGRGHQASPQLRVAHQNPGVNPNVLSPVGAGSYEPLSSQAHMTDIAVRVRSVA